MLSCKNKYTTYDTLFQNYFYLIICGLKIQTIPVLPLTQPVPGDQQADEHDPLQVKTPAGVSTNSTRFDNGTEEKTETEQTEVNEVNYATINYSLLPQKDDGDLKPQKVESDYAEIQIKKPNKDEKKQTLQDEVKQDEVTQSQEGGMES
ncbi:hypothetical protein Baya_8545 [Bagarius yarrelli]|uniref:Uncharacterized protein n=1 Tax=Bagarius yarrelli TaxID=175774 RepID=A0A556U5Y8_BAGYA|nr:hypothetical protein Baya_8545 [Bagarius yarrelli]